MKKTIGILLVICTLLLYLVSCCATTCSTCEGNKDILRRACNGKGREICDMCLGNGDCDDCAQGMVRDEPCSNSNCNNGYVNTSMGRLECQQCDGTGYQERECSFCDGSGRCFKCDGTGLKKNAKTCQHCNGAGRSDCPYCE